MKKILLLILLFPCLCSVGLSAKSLPPSAPKAIVMIYADDLGYADTGCYGASKIPTPYIDKLSSQGLRFTSAYSTSAVCTPSRYALLTGEYPWRKEGTGVLPGDAALIISPNRPTLPKMLKKHGYKTAAIGKWHLGLGDGKKATNWNAPISPGPNEIGFDESCIFAATGDRVPCVILENGKVAKLDQTDPISVSYEHNFPGLPNGKDNRNLLKLDWSHGHNDAIINGIGRIGFMKGGKSAIWDDEKNSDLITTKALGFIRENAKTSTPFFLYFATHDIHVPRCPNKRFKGKSGCGVRGDVVVELDDCVRRILKELDDCGLANDTLVIFTSDNGPVLDDGYVDRANEDANGHSPAGSFRAGKYSILEGGSRIPFIVRWPARIKGGGSSPAIINQMDLGATLLALLDPSAKSPFPDSENQLPALLGKDQAGRQFHVINSMAKITGIRSGKWKYLPPGTPIRDGINGLNARMSTAPKEGFLCDIEKDPAEKNNLAARFPDICKRLSEKLAEIKKSPSTGSELQEYSLRDD